ncbi:phage portal protein [Dechloromonas sp. CZR5]|uniref:phage portal protein n=1 Tax=Dechloromonas sp. CZR5 TaxID=2608630 RepID=UPI00123DC76E|nr:phage portal protein [Dechloromonas sp. CZR5]
MAKRTSRRHEKAANLAIRTQAMQKMAMALSGGAYHGASNMRPGLAGWSPRSGDSDSDTLRDLPTLRARSRDLVRNSPLAGGAINTQVTNVVGTGLAVQPSPNQELLGLSDEEAAAWASHTDQQFKIFAESITCDVTRHQNFYGLQDLAFRSALESGDTFAVLPELKRPDVPYKLAIQLVEADRISNPYLKPDTSRLTAGVEMDEWGAAVAAHICSHHPGSITNRATWRWSRVAYYGSSTGRRNVVHLFDRRRISQVRGIPMLAPVIEPLKQLQRYTDAELQAAVISGMFAVFIKMDSEAFHEMFDADSKDTYLQNSMKWDGSMDGSLDGAGKAINLLPGESVESASPGRPNALFDPFVQAIIRQIGVALEMPFEVLIKHFTSSYSAARAALLDAWRFFKKRREWLATYFCQPIYETWLEEAVATGRIRAPGFFADPIIRKAWCHALWIGDGPGSIDPEKEVNAAEKRINVGISTVAAESLLHDGIDWRVKHKQRVVEVDARREHGLDAVGQPAAAPAVEPDSDDQADQKTKTDKPQMLLHLHNHLPPAAAPQISVAAPSVEVAVEAIMPEQPTPNVTVEAVMPKADAPSITVEVSPTPVTLEATIETPPAQVVVQHPVAARQTVERDAASQEIVATVTAYQFDGLPDIPNGDG